jgi:hypothetical protein
MSLQNCIRATTTKNTLQNSEVLFCLHVLEFSLNWCLVWAPQWSAIWLIIFAHPPHQQSPQKRDQKWKTQHGIPKLVPTKKNSPAGYPLATGAMGSG